MKKNQKSKENYLRESCITNRVMLVFVAAAVGLWGFSRLSNSMNYAATFFGARTAAQVILALFLAGTAAALYFVYKTRSWETAGYKVVTPGLIAGFCGCGALGAWLMLRNFASAMQLLYVMLPVAAVLYLVYYTFQREFFLLCASGALSMLAMYACGSAGLKRVLPALAAIAVNGLLLYANLKGEKGLFRGFRVREAACCPKAAVAAYPVLTLLVLAALVLGSPLSVYLLYVTGGLLFVAAVYFTVKLL